MKRRRRRNHCTHLWRFNPEISVRFGVCLNAKNQWVANTYSLARTHTLSLSRFSVGIQIWPHSWYTFTCSIDSNAVHGFCSSFFFFLAVVFFLVQSMFLSSSSAHSLQSMSHLLHFVQRIDASHKPQWGYWFGFCSFIRFDLITESRWQPTNQPTNWFSVVNWNFSLPFLRIAYISDFTDFSPVKIEYLSQRNAFASDM